MLNRRTALLRGVNLGSRKLLMSDLARVCTELGFEDPQTLLASGNVVFTAAGTSGEVEAALESALARFGLITDVLVRDGSELAKAISANPFGEATRDHPSHVLVTFHREPFPPEALERLGAVYDGPESLHAIGRELFVDFCGCEQMRETKLLAGMRKARFPKVATARNWNTVMKLAAVLKSSRY